MAEPTKEMVEMTNTPLSRTKLKLQNEQTRHEQVKAEREEARKREVELTARLREQRLAKEKAEQPVDAEIADDNEPANDGDMAWPWRLPQPHRN